MRPAPMQPPVRQDGPCRTARGSPLTLTPRSVLRSGNLLTDDAVRTPLAVGPLSTGEKNLMSETKLVAQTRTEFGKGAARRLRRAGQVPAVLYGHGSAPVHVALPGHDTMLALKHSNALLEIDVEGKDQLAIAREVQRDPVKNVIEHVDLIIVKRGEKIAVEVPVVVEGESAPGTTHLQDATHLQLEVEATHIPEAVTVSIEGLEDGAKIHAGEITLPQGATLVSDAETLVVAVNEVRATEPEETEEGAEGETAEAAAEASAEA